MAGLASGLLTIRYPQLAIVSSIAPVAGRLPLPIFPVIFGALVWFGLREFCDRSTLRKAAAFVGASAIAGVLGQFAGFFGVASGYSFDAHPKSHPTAFFPAGFIGAFVLFSAALFLVFPKMTIRVASFRALPWSVAGGLLAVIGWALGPSLGEFLWFTLNRWHLARSMETFQRAQIDFEPQCYSLYLIWQIAVAFLLGVACRFEARRPLPVSTEAPLSARTAKPPGILFHVSMILLVLLVAFAIVGIIVAEVISH